MRKENPIKSRAPATFTDLFLFSLLPLWHTGDKLPVRGAVSLAAAYKEEKVERISYRSQMSLLVSVENGSVQIAGASVGVPYVLFDMQGRVVMKGRAPSANFNIPVAHAGNYIVRIGNKSQKVRIR